MNLDTLARAYIVHLLVRFTLYAYTIDATLRRKFRPFAYYRSVDVPDAPTGTVDLGNDRFKKFRRIGPAPLFVGIGKVRADIAESRRSEKCIDYRMDEDICVGMSL